MFGLGWRSSVLGRFGLDASARLRSDGLVGSNRLGGEIGTGRLSLGDGAVEGVLWNRLSVRLRRAAAARPPVARRPDVDVPSFFAKSCPDGVPYRVPCSEG